MMHRHRLCRPFLPIQQSVLGGVMRLLWMAIRPSPYTILTGSALSFSITVWVGLVPFPSALNYLAQLAVPWFPA